MGGGGGAAGVFSRGTEEGGGCTTRHVSMHFEPVPVHLTGPGTHQGPRNTTTPPQPRARPHTPTPQANAWGHGMRQGHGTRQVPTSLPTFESGIALPLDTTVQNSLKLRDLSPFLSSWDQNRLYSTSVMSMPHSCNARRKPLWATGAGAGCGGRGGGRGGPWDGAGGQHRARV